MSDELIKAQITLADMVRSSKMIEGSPFKPGDVVQMKKLSGPWMTVESIRTGHGGHFLISTVWFDKRRRVQGRYVATGFIPKFVEQIEAKGLKIPRSLFTTK